MPAPVDAEITKTYKMGTYDWQPLIDAMAYLKHLPQCGDVASRLEELFIAARDGKYYVIELSYEDQEGNCFVVGNDFEVVE